MSAESEIPQGNGAPIRRNRRSLLLPRFGVLALLSGVPTLIGLVFGVPGPAVGAGCFVAAMLVTIVYLAWLTLRTIELVAAHQSLNHLDVLICRYSGPLAWLLGFALLAFAIAAVSAAESHGGEPVFLRSRTVLQIIHFVMEIGFVLAITCVWSPRTLGHVWALPLWKLLCVLLIVIYGLYVVLIPVGVIASTLHVE